MSLPLERSTEERGSNAFAERLYFVTHVVLPVLFVLFLGNLYAARHESVKDLYDLTNYLGPVIKSVRHHQGLTLLRQGAPYIGTVPFRTARMPFPIYLLAGEDYIFRHHLLLIQTAKTFLMAIPALVAAWILFREGRGIQRGKTVALLTLPFLIPSLLLLAVSLQVEEGFYYGFLALLFAVLLAPRQVRSHPWLYILTFAVAANCLYLSKSSMRILVLVAAIGMLRLVAGWRRQVAVCLLAACGPIGWMVYTGVSSGRTTVASSLDGFNLHKGNYAEFTTYYPPPNGAYMDPYDYLIVPNTPMFQTEWQDNDYHMKQALDFMQAHPGQTLYADWKKFRVMFADLSDIGTGHKDDSFAKVDRVNMPIFRLLEWTAVLAALSSCFSQTRRWEAVTFLALLGAFFVPYLIGFALTRHAAPILYPCALYLAKFIQYGPSDDQTSLAEAKG